MDNQENIISNFNDYARKVTEEHTLAIRRIYAHAPQHSEERLQVFNKHLDTLKTQLQQQLKETVLAAQTALKDSSLVQARLTAIYNTCINDFFRKEF